MYILRCPDGTLFTGTTWDLSRRLTPNGSDRGEGDDTETTWGRPARLVYVEWFDRIDEAFYRERQVHGWRRWQKDRLIAESQDGWVDFG